MKKKIKWPYDPADPLRDIYMKKKKTLIWKKHMHSYVHCYIIYNNQDRETPKCPLMNEWINNITEYY